MKIPVPVCLLLITLAEIAFTGELDDSILLWIFYGLYKALK